MNRQISLLTVRSDRLTLELEGPPIFGLNRTATTSVRLRRRLAAPAGSMTPPPAEPSIRAYEAGTGALAVASGDEIAALVQEDTSYRLTVESLLEPEVTITTRDPRILSRIRPAGRQRSVRTGDLNFERQIGTFVFTISDGVESWEVSWEVFPSKVDYETDYTNLLDSLNRSVRALALENFRATHRQVDVSQPVTAASVTVEWLTLLRHYMQQLDAAVDRVRQHPHRVLTRRQTLMRADRISKVEPQMTRQIATGAGAGDWDRMSGGGRVREKLWTGSVVETVDNPENRYLKRSLQRIGSRLNDSLRIVGASSSHPQAQELKDLHSQISGYLSREPFASTSDAAWRPGISLALLQKPGYRETYSITRRLIELIELIDGDVSTSVKDLDDLYEAWCFIYTAELVRLAYPGAQVSTKLLRTETAGLGVGIAQRAFVRVESPGRTFTVMYNQPVSGLTGENRPDVTIRVDVLNWPHMDVIIDAKYRLKHPADGSVAAPPRDATDVCHRYRDAIIDPETGQRHTVRAVVAFPLNSADAEAFRAHPMAQAVERLGVGALPLLPGNTADYDRWILETIALPAAELANFGPDFAGATHAAKQVPTEPPQVQNEPEGPPSATT